MTETLAALGRFALRAVMTAFGLIFLASLLVAGLLAASGLTVWALLRGKRPPSLGAYRFFRPGAWRGQRQPSRQQAGDVVDVEVREIQ